ncbi:hypothetical protein MRB53_016894 [Persea americana]|uniref:Uncharacterized protein n=1 Tax=Persea americana TaxID=3435 RepID=A0ACC2M3K6_PERAE|nr:hypothetical protein MRB53_016894 [Persea americana]
MSARQNQFPSFSSQNMPIPDFRRNVLERNRTVREREKRGNSPLTRHLQKVYPIGIHKSNSSSPLSSLSLSQNSNDSLISSSILWDSKISEPFHLLGRFERREATSAYEPFHGHGPFERREAQVAKVSFSGHGSFKRRETPAAEDGKGSSESKDGNLKRCHWITKGSDQIYVRFHDEQWGVPEFDDNLLFELLILSGMLMDHNWTEILTKREFCREAFAEFDPTVVAKMEEKEIIELSSNKKLMLAESRVRCIVDNAKCIVKILEEYGSFSSFLWGYLNYRPMINGYRYPRNVPLRTPKSEAISKDLVRRGFRYVGPVIIYSFMQAAGMTNDHLTDCFRFDECVGLAERQWAHC